jgi:hypothetical protein
MPTYVRLFTRGFVHHEKIIHFPPHSILRAMVEIHVILDQMFAAAS